MASQKKPIEIRNASGKWRWFSGVAEAADRTGTNRRTMSSRLERGVDGYRYAGESQHDVRRRRREYAVKKAERQKRQNELRRLGKKMTPEQALAQAGVLYGWPRRRASY